MDTAQTITALFALLGGFFGAWLTRRSEFEKWHRQEKAVAIDKYVRQLYDAKFESSDAYHSTPTREIPSQNHKVTEPFVRLDKHKAIVRLYLSPSNRDELGRLQHKLWSSCTGRDGPAGRLDEVQETMHAIQVLLEKELSIVPGLWHDQLVTSLQNKFFRSRP